MSLRFTWWVAPCLVLSAQDQLKVAPSEATLIPKMSSAYGPADKAVQFTVTLAGKPLSDDLSAVCHFDPPKAGTWTPAITKEGVVDAPESLDPGVTQLQVKMKCAKAGAKDADPVSITIAEVKNSEWESRAIFGYHQAGASSANFEQDFFSDFFIMRGLGHHEHVYDNRFNLWGDVRIASSPQQISTPIAQFAATFAQTAGNLQVNQLALSAEYQAGLEVKITNFNQGNRRRMLGFIGFTGANGAFHEPAMNQPVFLVPKSDSQKYALFKSRYPEVIAAGATQVAFVPPDRQRFYRFFGVGFRLTSFELDKPYAPPATFAWTFGQDELVTGGVMRGVVSRLDVFYPLPLGLKDGKWKFLFLFGTVNQWWHKDPNDTALPLELAYQTDAMGNVKTDSAGKPIPVPMTDPAVYIRTVRNNRDTYRIGAGVDLVNIINSWMHNSQ